MLKFIYEPKGRAKEYGALACNIYLSCTHGCSYCYCPQAMHKERSVFLQSPHIRQGFLRGIERDAIELQARGIKECVFLSFVGDPYQPVEIEQRITRQAIMVLKMYGHIVRILTKGGMRATRDFDLLTEHDHFGVTLTCDNDADSLQWEPQAALPEERIDSLRYAHQHGIKTWVSLEPVLYPDQALHLIDLTHDCVDQYKVGKLNYHPRAKEIDWPKFRADVEARLKHYHAAYYLKRDLVEAK